MKFWKQKRRDKIRVKPFPEALQDTLFRSVPLYRRLPAAERVELHGHIHVLLEEKRFEGCGGLPITDEIRVTIAAQAAVLLLHRETDYFPELSSILVYPTTYVAPSIHAEHGVVTEFEDERAGETWDQGSLVLSWDDINATVARAPVSAPLDAAERRPGNGGLPRHFTARPPADVNTTADEEIGELVPAYNVVLHEFAHQLDLENGEMDGMPKIPSHEARQEWVSVMNAAFDQLSAEYAEGKEPVIDEYALEDPAEFFAVVTESFFETPFAIFEEYTALYQILKGYYRQDPTGWRSGPPRS